jgi:hypothetical protein
MNIKVNTKAVLSVETELGKPILEVLKPATEGLGLPINTVVCLITHSTGKSIEEVYSILDSENGVIVKVIEAYSEWIGKAFSVAEQGN